MVRKFQTKRYWRQGQDFIQNLVPHTWCINTEQVSKEDI